MSAQPEETQLSNPPPTSACQKFFILLATGVVLALASLTAALPITRHHQLSEYATSVPAGTIDDGDVAWMVVATILGFLLVPAFAYLYNHLYGKSSSALLELVLIVSAMITFVWIIFSFSLVYAKDANGDKILGYPKYFYMFAHTVNFPDADLAPTIPANIFAVFELIFALLTPAIVASAVFERVNVYGFLFFMFVWHLCIYSPIAHIMWNPNGFFRTNEIIDFSGGLVVNMLASITVLGTHLFLNWKGAPQQETQTPKNPNKMMFSAIVVWFLWFGINAGKAHNAGTVAAQSIVNTIGGVTVSVFFNFLIDLIFDYAQSDIAFVNSILLGLIATTPSSGYVTVGGSMVIALITVMVTRAVANFLLKESHDAPYNIVTLHGLGGTIAFLFTPFISYTFINSEGYDGLTFGFQTSIRHQLAAVLAIWSVGILSIFLCLFVCDLVVSLGKVNESQKGEHAPEPVKPAVEVEYSDVHKEEADPEGSPAAAVAETA